MYFQVKVAIEPVQEEDVELVTERRHRAEVSRSVREAITNAIERARDNGMSHPLSERLSMGLLEVM